MRSEIASLEFNLWYLAKEACAPLIMRQLEIPHKPEPLLIGIGILEEKNSKGIVYDALFLSSPFCYKTLPTLPLLCDINLHSASES